jgi:hypothetical protein
MKNLKYIIITAIIILNYGCNEDFLERYPLAELSPETYFSNGNELKTYTNHFIL